MYSKSVIILLLIHHYTEQNFAHTLNRKLDNSDCQAICASTAGRAEFDEETKLCRCSLPQKVDDTDIALINKTAKLIGKQLDAIGLQDHETVLIKREIPDTTTLEITETSNTIETTEQPTISSVSKEETTEVKVITTEEKVTTEEKTATEEKPATEEKASAIEETPATDDVPEEIVGQPHRRFHHRIGQRRHRDPRPLTADQQRFVMQQMRDHLNRLSQTTDPRARQIEIDAIRTNLRQLSQGVVPTTPQQRSRMRNIVEETRKRQQRQRLLHNPRLVGATATNDEDTLLKDGRHEDYEVESAVKEIFHHKNPPRFDIITQDPRLIDE